MGVLVHVRQILHLPVTGSRKRFLLGGICNDRMDCGPRSSFSNTNTEEFVLHATCFVVVVVFCLFLILCFADCDKYYVIWWICMRVCNWSPSVVVDADMATAPVGS